MSSVTPAISIAAMSQNKDRILKSWRLVYTQDDRLEKEKFWLILNFSNNFMVYYKYCWRKTNYWRVLIVTVNKTLNLIGVIGYKY
jgi:hypothetical protein